MLDADARVIQHINFAGDLKLDNDDGKPLMFFVLEELKNIIYDFLQRTGKYCERVLSILFDINIK